MESSFSGKDLRERSEEERGRLFSVVPSAKRHRAPVGTFYKVPSEDQETLMCG